MSDQEHLRGLCATHPDKLGVYHGTGENCVWQLDGSTKGVVHCFYGCGFSVVDSNPFMAHKHMEDHFEVAHREELQKLVEGTQGGETPMSRRKVWGITTGSYSDYSVDALFTTEKAAKAAAKANVKDEEGWHRDTAVAVFYLYDEVPEPVTEFFYQVEIWDNGRVTNERNGATTRLPWNHLWGEPRPRPNVRYVRAPMYNDKGGRLEVRGTDEQAVKQAFSDNKARLLADAQGVL